MERIKNTKEKKHVTIYLDKRAVKEQENEKTQEEIQKEANAEALKQFGRVTSVFLRPLVLMWLVNWLAPALGITLALTYLQAFALLMISKILFDFND